MLVQQLKSAVRTLLGGAILAAALWQPVPADEAKSVDQAAARVLSPEGFTRFHRMLLPQDGELQWTTVRWRTSITQARHQAAAENKPLLIFADTGAGFADALGLC